MPRRSSGSSGKSYPHFKNRRQDAASTFLPEILSCRITTHCSSHDEPSCDPPAPDLVADPPDDPEWHTFFTIRTGIRYTGMPAWDKTLSEQDIWKLTSFLAHMEKLPPAVQDYWKANFGVAAPTGEEEEKPASKPN